MNTANAPLNTLSCRDEMVSNRRMEMDDISRRTAELPLWQTVDGSRITRTIECRDFLSALALTNGIGGIAEDEGHHPDIQLSWGRVIVELTTHDVHGLTLYDFVLAAKIDRLAEQLKPHYAESP